MGIVSSVSNIYVYSGTLAGLYAGSLVNAGLLNNLGAAGVGSFTDNNGLLTPEDTAETLFSLNGGPAEEITYHGAGTVAMIGLFGIQLDSRPVAVFSSGGQTYLYAPQGLPLLSALSVSFDINPTASFALPVTPVDGVVQGMDSSEAMGVGYTDLQGDRITDGNDIIAGNGGNDTITAGGGDDLVYGGSGNDVLRGGTGRDTLFGGTGNDSIIGGDDGDAFIVTGGEGVDTIVGGEGGTDLDAIMFTSPGNGEGVSVVFDGDERGSFSFAGGGSGTFSQIEGIAGTAGHDTLDGTATTSGTVLSGGGGDDRILGGAGGDSLLGGSGGDTLAGGRGDDALDGGEGDDVAVFTGPVQDYIFDYGPNGELIVTDTVADRDGTDTLKNIEYVRFGGETFRLVQGDDTANGELVETVTETTTDLLGGTLDTADGTLAAVRGTSTLQGPDDGTPTLIIAHDGADWGVGHAAADALAGGAGNDTLDGFDGDDTLMGGDGADLLRGDGNDDLLLGGAGRDTLLGGTGNDLLDGGDDADTFVLEAGFGADTIVGGEGAGTGTDTDRIDGTALGSGISIVFTGTEAGTFSSGGSIATFSQIEEFLLTGGDDSVDNSTQASAVNFFGGAGNDTLIGGSGGDTLAGGDGDDYIEGGAGDDFLTTGLGRDTLIGGAGNDTLMNSAGDDSLDGGDGDDIIIATDGNDTLRGGTGADTMEGGNDADTFIVENGFGADVITGGEGVSTGTDFDTIDLGAVTVPVTVTFGGDEAGTITDGTDTLTFSQIERIILGASADVVDGRSAGSGMEILAGDGDDSIIGGSGADTIRGDAGRDTLQGGVGDDTLDGGADDDTAVFTGAVDEYTFSRGPGGELIVTDTVAGRDGTDTLTNIEYFQFGGTTYRLVEGDDGSNTTLQGADDGTPNLIIAHDGNDWGGGHATSDAIIGGAGDDTLDGGAGDDTLVGEAGNDLLRGDGDNDSISGGAGNDSLVGGAGDDTLDGGEGDDAAFFMGPVDEYTFSRGPGGELIVTDTVAGRDGSDTLRNIEYIDFGGTLYRLIEGDDGSNTALQGADDGTPNLIIAHDGNDWGGGHATSDAIIGGAGDDTLDGGAGDDTLVGEAGNDLLRGDGDNDSISGGTGDDTLAGDAGDDTLDGGADSDTAVFTGAVDEYTFTRGPGGELIVTDTVAGRDGTDTLTNIEYIDFGGTTYRLTQGDDGSNTTLQGADDGTPNLIIAHDGNDWGGGDPTSDAIFGGAGDDTLDGGAGDDTLVGEAGNDLLRGDGDNDSISGGAGNDTLAGGTGDDTLDGGADDDTAVFTGAVDEYTFTRGSGGELIVTDTVAGRDGTDTLTNIEYIDFGGTLYRLIEGDDGSNTALQGADDGTPNLIIAHDGNDWGGGHATSDAIIGGAGDDTLDGGAGDDTLVGEAGNDLLRGGGDNDSISGGTGDDTLAGGTGDDTLDGGADSDTAVFTGAVDEYTFSRGPGGELIVTDTVAGRDGTDTLTNIEYIDFGGTTYHLVEGDDASNATLQGPDDGTPSIIVAHDGNDGATGTATNDAIFGGAGEDTLDGGAGDDTVSGGSGVDSLSGGDGADSMSGGSEADTLEGGTGNDTLEGGTGNDSLSGGDGDDVFVYAPGDGADTISDFNFGNTGALGDGDTTNNDFIDLSGYYDDLGELRADFDDDGVLNQSNATTNGGTVDYSDNTAFAPGDSLTFHNTSRDQFRTDNTGVACFTAGTRILTPHGEVAVEDLRAGDTVLTIGSGPQPLLWTGCTGIDPETLRAHPDRRPVRLRKDLTGADRDILVSPQHAMLVGGRLVRARHMVKAGWPGARVAMGRDRVSYVHLLLPRHELVVAEGVPSESLYPGPFALAGMSPTSVAQIDALLPGIATHPSRARTLQIYGPTVKEVAGYKDLLPEPWTLKPADAVEKTAEKSSPGGSGLCPLQSDPR